MTNQEHMILKAAAELLESNGSRVYADAVRRAADEFRPDLVSKRVVYKGASDSEAEFTLLTMDVEPLHSRMSSHDFTMLLREAFLEWAQDTESGRSMISPITGDLRLTDLVHHFIKEDESFLDCLAQRGIHNFRVSPVQFSVHAQTGLYHLNEAEKRKAAARPSAPAPGV